MRRYSIKKISVPAYNNLYPQTLFVYRTINEDGTPNFGLFCWFSYCRFDQMGVICAIGDPKRTLENIRHTGVSSANGMNRQKTSSRMSKLARRLEKAEHP